MKKIYKNLLLIPFIAACTLAIHADVSAATAPWYRNPWNDTVTEAITHLPSTRVEQIPVPILFGIGLEDFSPNYGVPRSGGRTHEGQDILGILGTPIVSPTDAVVTYIRYGASAGHSVYTANPGGETFVYLHLDRVNPLLKVGQTIKKGDLLGYLGDTGNAKGGPAHLHFELLTNHPNDPYPRIKTTFTETEKFEYLQRIFATQPPEEQSKLKKFLEIHFPEMLFAINSNIPPTEVAVEPSTTQTHTTLSLTDEGAEVIALQEKLIIASVGSHAIRLSDVGATGYFGPLTKAALIEYQNHMGIAPADGTYGPNTKIYLDQVNKQKNVAPPPTVAAAKIMSETPDKTAQSIPQQNLDLGDKGDAVIWLQNYLIAKKSGLAANQLATVGATGYFGPLTQQALAEYQRTQGITPAIGYFGPITRASIL